LDRQLLKFATSAAVTIIFAILSPAPVDTSDAQKSPNLIFGGGVGYDAHMNNIAVLLRISYLIL
jgi:hypothetical protein